MNSKNIVEIVTIIFKMQYTLEIKLQNLKSLLMLDSDKLKEVKIIFADVEKNNLLAIKEELSKEIALKVKSLEDSQIEMFIQHYDERIQVIKSSFKKVKNSKNLDKCNGEAQKILNEIITETVDLKSQLKVSFLYICIQNLT
jgi:uncharacterized protein YbgA (DUF1722 family)